MKKVIQKTLIFIISGYLLLTRKTYYISGTGIEKATDKRVWFKLVFHTHGKILPLKSIELKAEKEMPLKGCVIVYFRRIPKKMAKYVESEYEIKIL